MSGAPDLRLSRRDSLKLAGALASLGAASAATAGTAGAADPKPLPLRSIPESYRWETGNREYGVFANRGVAQTNIRAIDDDNATTRRCGPDDDAGGVEHRFVATSMSFCRSFPIAGDGSFYGFPVLENSTTDIAVDGNSCDHAAFTVNHAWQVSVPILAVLDSEPTTTDARAVAGEVRNALEDLPEPGVHEETLPAVDSLNAAVGTLLGLGPRAFQQSNSPFQLAAGLIAGKFLDLVPLVKTILGRYARIENEVDDNRVRLVHDNAWRSLTVTFVDFSVVVPSGESGTVTVTQSFGYSDDITGHRPEAYPGAHLSEDVTYRLHVPPNDNDEPATAADPADIVVAADEAFTGNVSASTLSPDVGEAVVLDASDYDATFEDEGIDPTYLWEFSDGTTATGRRVAKAFDERGTYGARLHVGYGDLFRDPGNDGPKEFSTGLDLQVGDWWRVVRPVAVMAPPERVVAPGESIDLDATSSYHPTRDVASYEWRIEGITGSGNAIDPITHSGSQSSHTFLRPGTYQVGLTVTDEEGVSDSATRTVSVVNGTPASAFTPSATEFVYSEGVTCTPDGSGDPDGSIVAFEWDFGDGTTDSRTWPDPVHHVYERPGTYTVSLSVHDDDGNTDTSERTVEAKPDPPEVTLSASPDTVRTDVDGNPDVTFAADASDSDGEVVELHWRGDIPVDDRPTPSAMVAEVDTAFQTPGEYEGRVTAVDDHGARRTASATVTVENRPPVVDLVADKDVVEIGETVEFFADVADQDGTVVLEGWTGIDGDGRTEYVTFDAPGEHEVTYTVTDDNGATASDTVTVRVDTDDAPSVVVSASSDTVYQQRVVEFTAEAADDVWDASELTYEWSGDVSGVGSAVSEAFDHPGTKVAEVTVTDGAGNQTTGSASVTVENHPPVVDVTADRTWVERGETVEFVAEVSDPDDPIFFEGWSGIDADDRLAYASFSTPGDHEVTYTVADEEGVVTSDSITVHVDDDDRPSVSVGAYPDPADEGEEVTFTASAWDDVTTDLEYAWSGAVSGSSDTVTKRFYSGGNKTAYVTVTDGAGNQTTGSVTVTVEPDQLDSGDDSPDDTTTTTDDDGGGGSGGELQRSVGTDSGGLFGL